MAEAQKENDQSMDDILASIRKIISDDGTPVPVADSANAGGEVAADVDQGAVAATLGAGAPGQLDDLSDIFEQPNDADVADGMSGQAQNSPAVATGDQTPWRFEEGEAQAGASHGSLTDKLASLNGRANDQPSATVEPRVEAAPVATVAEASPQALDDVSAAASGQSEVSLQDTLENVRKAAAVAAVPEVAQSRVVEPVAEPEPILEPIVEKNLRDASSDVAVAAPQAVAEVAGQVEALQEAKAPVEIQPEEGVAIAVGAAGAAATVAKTNAVSGATVGSGQSIEALVTEALKPMLQQWLDANLPRLVEEKLQEELKRRTK